MSKLINLFTGCLLVSLGLLILRHSHLVTGGTAGLALSLSYLFEIPFSVIYFFINLPFYVLSVMRMGWNFTLSTVFVIAILSFVTGFDHWLPDFSIPPLVGSSFGGVLIGIGVSLVFLNGSSLGGATILALYLQKKFGWDPGKTNFLFDLAVVATGVYSIGFWKGFCSVLSIFVLAAVVSRFKNRIAAKINPAASVAK